MAGGLVKYRHLGRKSSHRKALLRNLVTSLFEHESISTTWHKAKETQRMADKLITLAKRNTEASRRRAHQIFFRPLEMVPKLFGPIRERYADRPGGYTRVLRIEPLKEDQAESAILELVDGPRDTRFAMVARTLARDRDMGRAEADMTELTAKNLAKVTRYTGETGRSRLEEMVLAMRERMKGGPPEEAKKTKGVRFVEEKEREPRKRRVYPEQEDLFHMHPLERRKYK